MAKRPKSSRRKSSGPPVPSSLGAGLDEIGFEQLGHRIVVGKAVVAKPVPLPNWVGPVVEFLAQCLPDASDGGWDHLSISAYEVAGEALIALGHAVEATGGVRPVAQPKLPAILPRWDDIATAVVSLSSQSGVLGYRHFAGTRSGPTPAGLLRSNIRAAYGSGPAYLEPWAFPVFQSLGLILGGRWTEQAETILWRDYVDEWGIDFTENRRFVEACEAAVADVPKDIAAEIGKMATFSEQDIKEWLEIPRPHASIPKTRDDALRSLRFWSCFGVDRVFSKRWRLGEGWLSVEESKRTLYFHFDPVALHLRREFARRYMPELPFLSK